MLLYHGTSYSRIRSILRNGIQPRSVTGMTKNTSDFASMQEAVYLTDGHALHFACNASQMHERWVVIEVDTEKIPADDLWLVPDELFLEQVTRGSDLSGIDGFNAEQTIPQRVRAFQHQIHNFSHLWQSSLDGIGSCAHLGSVPFEAMTRVVVIDPSCHPFMCGLGMNPDMTVSGYAVSQHKYRELTRWAAGYRAKASEINDGIKQPVVWIHDDRNDIAVKEWQDRQRMILDGMRNRLGFEFIIGDPEDGV